MKLWMIIVLAGQIGAVAGPLPYGMDECQRRALEQNMELRLKILESEDQGLWLPIPGAKVDNSFFYCLASPTRPQIEADGAILRYDRNGKLIR